MNTIVHEQINFINLGPKKGITLGLILFGSILSFDLSSFFRFVLKRHNDKKKLGDIYHVKFQQLRQSFSLLIVIVLSSPSLIIVSNYG